MATPAGWYTDPSGRYAFRYWDGAHWTCHVSDPQAPTPEPQQPTAALATTTVAVAGESALLAPQAQSRSERQARLREPRQARRRVMLIGAGISALGLLGVAAFTSSGANDSRVATSGRSATSVPHTEVTRATVAATTTAPPTTLPPTTSAPTTTVTRAAPPPPTTTATRAAPPTTVAAPAPSPCPNGSYVNSSGDTICSPYAAPGGPPSGATARCNDGTYSFAAHHQGACSSHGGVAEFYN